MAIPTVLDMAKKNLEGRAKGALNPLWMFWFLRPSPGAEALIDSKYIKRSG
jgi:hypothetical protein